MAVDSLSSYGYSQYIANSGTTQAERAKPKNGNLCVDPKSANIAWWDPSLYDPNRKVKKDNTKRNIIAAGTAVATAALLFLTRGKIKNIPFIKNAGTWLKGFWTNKIKPFGQKIVDWFKKLFGKGKTPGPNGPVGPNGPIGHNVPIGPNNPTQLQLPAPNGGKPVLQLPAPNGGKPVLQLPAPNGGKPQLLLPAPTTNTTSTVATNTIKSGGSTAVRTKVTPEELKGIDLKHVRDSHNRQMVQRSLDDVVTDAEQLAYNRAHRYQAPTTEQAAAIRRINAESNRASAISRQIQNNVDESSLAALERARLNLTA